MGGFGFNIYGWTSDGLLWTCYECMSLCSLLKYCNHLYIKIHKANKMCGVIPSSVHVDSCSGQPFTPCL
jgi:hypothetical protein